MSLDNRWHETYNEIHIHEKEKMVFQNTAEARVVAKLSVQRSNVRQSKFET